MSFFTSFQSFLRRYLLKPEHACLSWNKFGVPHIYLFESVDLFEKSHLNAFMLWYEPRHFGRLQACHAFLKCQYSEKSTSASMAKRRFFVTCISDQKYRFCWSMISNWKYQDVCVANQSKPIHHPKKTIPPNGSVLHAYNWMGIGFLSALHKPSISYKYQEA